MFNWFGQHARPGSARTKCSTIASNIAEGQQQLRQLGVQCSTRHDGNGNIAVSVTPPEAGPPPKLDICIIIDTSGSMADAANPNGAEEAKLFSKMDLAKRGAEVIARSLGPDDTLAILGFESRVTRWLERTPMDEAGLNNALSSLAQLRFSGGTALWDGLCAGLQELEVPVPQEEGGAAQRLAVAILLTDGQPCPSPPEGELAELGKYLASHAAAAASDKPLRTCKLVTMGFGYDVNSKLLQDLATTHGQNFGNDFAFIPDGTMLLTNFVNLMANLKSTCMRRAVLRITPTPQGATSMANGGGAGGGAGAAPLASVDVAEAMDAAFTTDATHAAVAAGEAAAAGPVEVPSLVSMLGETSWRKVPLPDGSVAMELLLGDLLYGCPRTVLLRKPKSQTASTPTLASQAGAGAHAPAWRGWTAELAFEPLVPGCAPAAAWPAMTPALDAPYVTRQLHRALAVSAIQTALRVASVDLYGAQKYVKDCALATIALQGSPLQVEPHPILEDLLGQVSEAVSTQAAWSKWGSHYLRSLISAHRAEACNNFKDPGVLAYGSAYSRRCREELNTMCDSLPPPKPSILPVPAHGTAIGQPVRPVSAATFRRNFNNRHGGCFAPGGRVLMADGTLTPVQQLRKGDSVRTPDGSAQVVCVVKHAGVQTLRLPGSGLGITAWHPVRLDGTWHFPVTLAAATIDAAASEAAAAALACTMVLPAGTVYNLVLDAGHVVVIDGVEAVTLGHGFQDAVVRHPFYGSHSVIDCLKAQPGWEAGLVDLGHAAFELDAATGLVSGMSCAHAVGSAQPCTMPNGSHNLAQHGCQA